MTNPVDEMFDLAATPTSDGPDTTAPSEPTNETETPESADSTESTDLYPNVLKTYTANDLPAGEAPPNTMTIPEFTGHLTLENITKRGMGVDGIVKDQNVYNATKAKRDPIPVVLVFSVNEDGSVNDNQKDAKVYIPVAEGTEAYLNRPERGSGTSTSTSKRSDEDLIEDASKKRQDLNALQDRIKKLAERVEKAQNVYDKYGKWLSDRNLSWEKVDEFDAAQAAKAEAAEESAPSEPDNDNA